LRGKGTRNSPNGALYGSGSLSRCEPALEARTGGRGDWVEELRGTVPELMDGSAGPRSGQRELAPVRCLTVGPAVAESWVAQR
jgi:hypothetical protein